jgi:hypothetical protein
VADVRIGADWVQGLERYIQGLAATSELAASRATTYLEEVTVARARDDADWSEMADQIEVWSADGILMIGIQDDAYVSKAFNLEYGDAVTAPNSLFRTMQGEAEGMSKVMDDTFRQHYGDQY